MAYINGEEVLFSSNVMIVDSTIDQTYNPKSENAQSGVAVEQAINTIIDNTAMLKYLTYNIANNEVAITKCDKSISGNHIIPDRIEGYPVTSISSSAFLNCSNLKSITILDGVKSIGNLVFENCTSLKSIIMPDSVTSIGHYAFYNCTSLKKINIPNSVTSIGSNAFEYCESLRNIEIPDSVTSIGSSAFQNCTSLNEIYYYGSKEQWVCIAIAENNEVLNNATIYYNQSFEALNKAIRETLAQTKKIASVSVYANQWVTVDEDVHTQVVNISGTTNKSQISIELNLEQNIIFRKKDISFLVGNNNGIITVYCIGQKPTNDYTMQVKIEEVIINE